MKKLLVGLALLASTSTFAIDIENYIALTTTATESIMDTYNYPIKLDQQCDKQNGIIISRSNDGVSVGVVCYTGNPRRARKEIVISVTTTQKTRHILGRSIAAKCSYLGGRLIAEVVGKGIVKLFPEFIEGVISRTNTPASGACLLN